MRPKSLTKELLLAVIRGQLPLSELKEVGVHISEAPSDNSGHERRISLEVASSITVAPKPIDIAIGLLTYKEDPSQLRDWASFVLGASEIIDLAPLVEWPEGDELLGGLWDASFEGNVSDNIARIAAMLIR